MIGGQIKEDKVKWEGATRALFRDARRRRGKRTSSSWPGGKQQFFKTFLSKRGSLSETFSTALLFTKNEKGRPGKS